MRGGFSAAPLLITCSQFPYFSLRARFGCLSGLFVLTAEALNAAGGVHQLLLAGEERVAVRADFQVDIALMSGSGGKAIPAGAHDAYLVVCGVDIGFQLFSFSYHRGTRSLSASFPGGLYFSGFGQSAKPLGKCANYSDSLFR